MSKFITTQDWPSKSKTECYLFKLTWGNDHLQECKWIVKFFLSPCHRKEFREVCIYWEMQASSLHPEIRKERVPQGETGFLQVELQFKHPYVQWPSTAKLGALSHHKCIHNPFTKSAGNKGKNKPKQYSEAWLCSGVLPQSVLARHSPLAIPRQKGKIPKGGKISLEEYKKHALFHLFFLIQTLRHKLSNWNQNTQKIHTKNASTWTTPTIPWNHLRPELLK